MSREIPKAYMLHIKQNFATVQNQGQHRGVIWIESPGEKLRNSIYSCTDNAEADKSDMYTTVLKWHIIKKQNIILKEALSQTPKLTYVITQYEHCSTLKYKPHKRT